MIKKEQKQKVNIKQISEITNFSPATISNALNRKKGVNKETAAKVFSVAKELGYISEDTITKIKFVIFKKNGLIIDDTPFFSLMIDGIEKECRTLGFEMVLTYLNQEDKGYEEQVKWLIHDKNSAVILLGTELMEDDLLIYKSASCPFLTLDYWCWDMSFNGVLINNDDSARMAVQYLIKKGHKEIGYLKGSFRIKGFRFRSLGYKTAMTKAKLPIKEEYCIPLGTTINGAYQDMMIYLKRNVKLPSAFFADNDIIALGAMKALQEFGYRIPEDISIIGFDDLPFSEISSPALTTLRVPKQEMGKLAVRRIMEMIRGDIQVKTKIQVCTTFIERESVRELTKLNLDEHQ